MAGHERAATERPYLSIGEVLGLLLDEFPDVTISKIRFLESQGLIEPERTASGYRKFYDADVDRLRFILREQRENYLPLKVIRDRLGETPTGGVARPETDVRATPETDPVTPATSPQGAPGEGPAAGPDDPTVVMARPAAADATPDDRRAPVTDPREAPSEASVRSHPAASAPLPGAAANDSQPRLDLDGQAGPDADAAAAPAASSAADAPAADAPAAGTGETTARRSPAPPSAGQLSRAELLAATAIDGKLLDELESFGLVASRSVGQQPVYDGHARQVCELAGAFQQLGIEVRHLRAWKSSAEREVGLFEQRIMPLLRQRNPSAREQSLALLRQMVQLGADLRHVLVAQALRQYTDE